MAKNMIYAGVNFNIKPADSELTKLEQKLEATKKQLKETTAMLSDAMKHPEKYASETIAAYTKLQKTLTATIKQTKSMMDMQGRDMTEFARILEKTEGANVRSLKRLNTELNKIIASAHYGNKEEQKQLSGAMEYVDKFQAQVRAVQKGFTDMNAMMKDTKFPISEMQRWIKLVETDGLMLANDIKQYREWMQQTVRFKALIKEQGGFASITKANNKGFFNTEQLQEYARFYEQLSKDMNASQADREVYLKRAASANKELDKRTVASANSLSDGQMGQLSDMAIKTQLANWQKLRDEWVLAGKDATQLDGVIRRLSEVQQFRTDLSKEQQTIALWETEKAGADKLYESYKTLSDDALQSLIRKYEKVRETATELDKPTEAIRIKLERLRTLMSERKDEALLGSLDKMYQSSEKLSDSSLDKLLNQYIRLREEWEIDGKDASELTRRITDLQQKSKERSEFAAEVQAEQMFKKETEAAERMYKVYENLSDNGIQQLVNKYTKLRDEAEAAGKPVENINSRLAELQDELRNRSDNDLIDKLQYAFDSRSNLSEGAINNLIAQYTKLADTFSQRGLDVDVFKAKVTALNQELTKRKANAGETVFSDVEAFFNGNISRISSVSDMQEAIKKLEEWRKVMDVSSEEGISRYNNVGTAIDQLKNRIAELNKKTVSSEDILQKYMSGMGDVFKKPAEELERDKAALEKWRKELAKAGADKEIIEQIDDALKGINHELSMTGESTSDWRKTLELARNGKLSYTELKDAISKMRTELENTKLEDGGFAEKSRILQDMDRQLKATNEQLGYHASTLEQATSRLKSYVLVYIGFNEAVASLKSLIESNIEYSDSLANVQKISGLARSEINRLSDAVNALDTRTSQTELMDLAFEGSKLGVAARSGAAGLTEYVEAANQLNQTLGEGGSAEAITQLMKINDVMGNTKAMGIKNALLATGSAILDIGNKSTASYGNVQQFVASLGGLAATAYIPMADLVAIAGTVDTTGQGIDKSATAIGKLISQIASKPKVIAQAVGIDPEEMENLVKTHKMTEALVMVLEKLKGAELGDINLRLKQLVSGKTNQQALQVISSVARQTDELNRQLAISRNAFDEASSATKMYNLMNEDAAGMIARMGNQIKYWFTNSNITTWLEDVLRKIVDLPRKIEQFSNTIKVAAIAIVAGIGTVRFSLVGLQWEVKRLLVHIRQLWAAMMANPAGAIMAAVGAVITLGVAISDAIKARDLEYQATKRVDKATDDLTKSLNSEKGMASLLFNELKSLEKGSEEYDKVKNKIIANYGQYLEGQTEEIKNLENLAAAQEIVTKAIEDTTRAKIRDAAVSEAYNSYLGSTGDEYVKIRDAYKQAGHSDEEAELFIGRIRNYLDAGKALPKALQDEVDKFTRRRFKSGGFLGMSSSYATAESNAPLSNPIKDAINGIRNAKKALDKELDDIDTRVGKAMQAIETATGGDGAGSGSGNGDGLPDLPQKEPKGPTPAEIEKNGIGSAMAQLETYFNERRAMIDDAYLKDEITYDERERELDAIEQEHLQKRYELRKYILGEQEKFETEKYLQMGEGELTVIRRNLKNLGEAEIDGVRKNAEADKAEMNKRLSDIKHEVEKITEVNNPFDNLIQKFASSIFKLNMLIDQSETDILRSPERMRKETEKRTMFLVEQSRRAYELTAQSLRESMNNEGLEFWAAMLSDEEMAAIIIELQQFYHDYEETFRKSTDHLNTLMGMYWKQADYGKDGKSLFQIYNEQVSAAEQTLATDQKIAGWGYAGKTLAGNTRVQDAGIELSRQKIEMGMAEIEMIRAKMDAEIAAAKTNEQKNLLIRQQEDMTAEKMKAVNELIREEANQQIDAYASVISQLQPYAQALENFGSQFGEAIYGSKEDRQKAGQELLKSVIKTTTQIITQWLIMEATRKIQIQQEIMMEQYKQAMITAEYLKGEAARIQTEQAVFLYMTAKDTAEGIGKEVAHLGLKGFIIGAAITAAMALLTSAITPKYQAAEEATKAGGSGKLVTGMLTYAEGRYPVYADGQYEVQGRNGRSYNARYEDRLATRVYGGGARFGIFSEEMPEAVIDGPTTRRLTMDYSGIWKDILSLSRTGSLAPGSPYAQRMNAYANGNLSMIPAGNAAGTVAADNAALAQMIAQNNAIMQQLQAQLSAGIRARMTMFGDDDSLDSSIAKMNRMKKKYGLGK